jgi:hypothetical protein
MHDSTRILVLFPAYSCIVSTGTGARMSQPSLRDAISLLEIS